MKTPIRYPFWWSDGVHVLPMTDADREAWLALGVSRGWVIPAADDVAALEIARGLKKAFDKRTKQA